MMPMIVMSTEELIAKAIEDLGSAMKKTHHSDSHALISWDILDAHMAMLRELAVRLNQPASPQS